VPDADSPVLHAIRALLRQAGVPFSEAHHEPTFTSEQSAAARGESTRIGGKSLVLKVDGEFGIYVLSAHLQLHSRQLRKQRGARRYRFATTEELQDLTGLVPGCVPPFGPPILDLPLFADPSVLANQRIAFNAGSLTDSVIMATTDWQALARPEWFPFSRPANP
jgi:Ala-tRNA(Pro) deacylase